MILHTRHTTDSRENKSHCAFRTVSYAKYKKHFQVFILKVSLELNRWSENGIGQQAEVSQARTVPSGNTPHTSRITYIKSTQATVALL